MSEHNGNGNVGVFQRVADAALMRIITRMVIIIGVPVSAYMADKAWVKLDAIEKMGYSHETTLAVHGQRLDQNRDEIRGLQVQMNERREYSPRSLQPNYLQPPDYYLKPPLERPGR